MKNAGQISMECYTYLRNIQDLLSDGKTPHVRRFGKPLKGPVILFGAMVECHHISAKDLSRQHHFGSKVLPGLFLGCVLYAGGIWKGDIMVADVRRTGGDGRIRAPRPKAQSKGSANTPQRSGNFIFQSQMEQSKSLGENRDNPDRGEEQEILRGEAEGSSSTPRQDLSWYDGEAKSDFGSTSGFHNHVESRVKLYVPTEESFSIPLKYIDVTRTIDTTSDVMSEKHRKNTDFGQSRFGHRGLSPANLGQNQFGPIQFWPFCPSLGVLWIFGGVSSAGTLECKCARLEFSGCRVKPQPPIRKLKVTSGPLQENSFIVITSYQESICTCFKKKHFTFR